MMDFNVKNLSNISSFVYPETDFIFGCMLISTSVIALLAYTPVLWAMLTSKLLTATCYKFMISLGLSDMTCLIGWTVLGIHTVTHGQEIAEWFIVVTIAMLVIGWGNLCAHLAMISVNMYVSVCWPTKQNYVYTKRNVKLLICVCWVYALVIHGSPTLFISPHMTYDLNSYMCVWKNSRVEEYYRIEDITFVTLISALFLACYVGIMIKYAQVRKRIARNVGVVIDGGNPSSSVNRRQFKLVLQTAVRFATFFIYDILYYVMADSADASHVSLTFIFGTYLWCLNNAISPFIYLCFNGQLQSALRRNGLTTKNVLIKSSTTRFFRRHRNVWTLSG